MSCGFSAVSSIGTTLSGVSFMQNLQWPVDSVAAVKPRTLFRASSRVQVLQPKKKKKALFAVLYVFAARPFIHTNRQPMRENFIVVGALFIVIKKSFNGGTRLSFINRQFRSKLPSCENFTIRIWRKLPFTLTEWILFNVSSRLFTTLAAPMYPVSFLLSSL